MEFVRLRVFALALIAAFASPAIADDGVRIAYSEVLRSVSFDDPSASSKPGSNSDSTKRLRFDAFSKAFDFRLVENRALVATEQLQSMSSGIGVYRGELANVKDSWVRLVIADGKPRGLFWDGQDIYAVEAVAGEPSSIIYRLDDLSFAPGMLSCSHSGSEQTASDLLGVLSGEVSEAVSSEAVSSGPGATSQIEIAVIGDFEFVSAQGASAEADLIARMNNIDGIFSAQLGVQLTIGRLDIYTDNNDPFSDSTSSATLLEELADYRNATPEQNDNGLSHLFSGRNFDGSTVGRAYRPALCSRRFGAGITQGTFNLTTDSLIAAHEIGHNFGAPHDGDADDACGAEPETFLMAPRLNGADQFSSCSLSQMQARVANASCVTPLPSTDVAVLPGSQNSQVLLGDASSVSFSVNSVGTNTANDVNIEIGIPAAVELTSAATDTGTCSSGAGSVSCALGSIAAGAGATVTLNVSTAATGSAAFDASITAAVDENSNNNQTSVQLNIDPAVDLSADAAAPAQVLLTQSTSVNLSVDNLAVIDATDVVLTVSPSAGLSIDGASWAAGTCSVANDVLTCEASTLAAESNNAVSMQLSSGSVGDYSYSMSVTSNDTDRDPGNNDATGTVSVPANAAPSLSITAPSDGGSSVSGNSVTLAASATDPEDGDISSNITWSSDRDGALGTGANLSVTTLSVGTHTITASVSDSGNEGATATTTLTVTETVAAASGDSGGGAMGMLMMFVLSLTALIRVSRRSRQ